MTKNRRMKQNPQKGKRMAVNVREIAKKANVSAATVSRVLHQSEQVKPETRKKVEEAMRQLQVTAGELVRSARMDTRIVGTFLGEDALAAVGALAYIVWSIAAIFRAKGHRKDRAYSAALGAADICLTVYVLFCLMWGVNYWTDSFQDRAGITAQPVTETELEAVTRYFAEQLTAAADSVPRDENGLYAVPKVQILEESTAVYGGVTELYPFLRFRDTGVKAVLCSRLMSIMGFTGVYFSCIGESNVNVDSPACLLPSTIAHELAHQRGIAWEQECNFLGVLASVTSGLPDYAYSGWLLGFIHLGNALYDTDPAAYWAIRDTLPETVETDLRDNNAYWDQFRDNIVEKVSDTVYDAALKSYGDANGMRSYSMVVELLVAYYRNIV